MQIGSHLQPACLVCESARGHISRLRLVCARVPDTVIVNIHMFYIYFL